MATNGIIVLDLGDRNAATFDRISVPGCYAKVAGAEEAGGFITVYKWTYQGFIMSPSVCVPTKNQDDSYTLTDKMKGGTMTVFPNDTIYLEGSSSPGVIESLSIDSNGVYTAPAGVSGYSPVNVSVVPELGEITVLSNGVYKAEDEDLDGFSQITVEAPEPEFMDIAYHVYSGNTTQANASLMIQKGYYRNGIFYDAGDPVEVTKSMASPWPYILDGIATISWSTGWLIQTTNKIHQWLAGQWVYALKGNHLEMWDYDSANNSTYLRTLYPINVGS